MVKELIFQRIIISCKHSSFSYLCTYMSYDQKTSYLKTVHAQIIQMLQNSEWTNK